MIQEGQWESLAAGLLERGIMEAMLEQIYHLRGEPVLNGLFAVGKGEYVNGIETQRLIMNLTPVNALCRSLAGDVGTLPAISGLNGYLLDDGEVVLLSSEDIRCFFYLFSGQRYGGLTWGLIARCLRPCFLRNGGVRHVCLCLESCPWGLSTLCPLHNMFIGTW